MQSNSFILILCALILSGCTSGNPPVDDGSNQLPEDYAPEATAPEWIAVEDSLVVNGANAGNVQGMVRFVALPGNLNCIVIGSINEARLTAFDVEVTNGDEPDHTMVWELRVVLPGAEDEDSKRFELDGDLPLTLGPQNVTVQGADQLRAFVQPGAMPPSASIRKEVNLRLGLLAENPDALTVRLDQDSCAS